MPKVRVVLLSSHSLYGEGVLARFRSHQNSLELHVVEADQVDALDQIVAIRPTAIVVDASDKEANENCPLGSLLSELPEVRIIRLDPITQGFQLVTSEQHEAEEVQELLAILRPNQEADEG